MNRRRRLALAAATVMLMLGAGAALAAAGPSSPASDFLGDVAKRLGISEDRLQDAIQDETIARIDAAVAAGEITEAEGDALKRRVRSGGAPVVLPSFGGPEIAVGPRGVVGPRGTDLLGTAAAYLGMDEADLHQALRDGKSLADLANDKNKPVEGLVQALRDEIRRDADEAVDDGVLTEQQADRLVNKLAGAVDEFVENAGGLGFPLDQRVPGFGFGPGGPLVKPIVPGILPGPDLMEKATEYLGMEESDLRARLRDGESLADLARAKGKSVDGLEQALVGAIREDVDRAVDDGGLTKEQADRIIEDFRGRVDDLVEARLKSGLEFRGRGDGFEFHFRVEPHRVPPPEERSSPAPIVPLKPS